MKVLVGEVNFLHMPNQCMVLVAYHCQQYFYYISSKRINKTLTSSSAGKLRLGYPKSTTPKEIPF